MGQAIARRRGAVIAICLAAAVGSFAASARGDDSERRTPMFCSIRVMSGANRDFYVSQVFRGRYSTDMLRHKNAFGAYVNAYYGNLVSWAAYCNHGEDEDEAYYRRDQLIASERAAGSNVILTPWAGR